MKAIKLLVLSLFLPLITCNVQEITDDFPLIIQKEATNCGPVCLQMICKYYGKEMPVEVIEDYANKGVDGTSLLGLSEAADQLNLENLSAKISYEDFISAPLPAIAHWNKNHFIVVYKIDIDSVSVADPSLGKQRYSRAGFEKKWLVENDSLSQGIVLLLDKEADFFD